jgi:hypothetical protein
MASVFQPPPTYALPVVVDEITGRSVFNPIWLRWFIDLSKNFTATATGSHESLSGLLGGGANNHYHLTSSQTVIATQAASGIQSGYLLAADWTTFNGKLSAISWDVPGTIGSTTPNTIKGTTVQASTAAGFISSDGSTGYTGTITTASLVGKTVTIKDGIITSIV